MKEEKDKKESKSWLEAARHMQNTRSIYIIRRFQSRGFRFAFYVFMWFFLYCVETILDRVAIHFGLFSLHFCFCGLNLSRMTNRPKVVRLVHCVNADIREIGNNVTRQAFNVVFNLK